MKTEQLKAFIFDMDGTLVDSKLDFDAMREELSFPTGVPLLEYIESLGDTVDITERKKYFDIIHKHELQGAIQSTLMEGCRDFLQELESLKIKTAVLTRNSLKVTRKTFEKLDLSFEEVLTRDCTDRPKPDPQGLLLICKRLQIRPAQAVYMGDFLLDLEAAKNAGMGSVLYSPNTNSELEKHADYIVRSFKTFKNEFDEKFLKQMSFQL